MIHQLTLSNGFTLLGEVLPHFRSASFSFWTGLGSVWDPVGKYGMAAFVCEMMLRGAGNLSNRQFLETIDRIGIDRTESLTASTLEFRASMLAENLEAALDLYADLLRRPVLPRDQMEDGRQVLLQEISFCEDNPEGRLSQVMSERFFGPAWGHDEDGNREGIESITWEEVCAQYDTLMMPNQCVLAVAGNFDWKKTAEKVRRLFGDWEPKTKPELPPNEPRRESLHISFDSPQTCIELGWEITPLLEPNWRAEWAGISILGGGMNSRLFNEVREKRGLCYDVGAHCVSLHHAAGAFCTASCREENARETLDVIRSEIERLKEGVTEEELRAYKARHRMALVMEQESSLSLATGLITDWKRLGRIRTFEEISAEVQSLTVEKVNDVLRRKPANNILVCTQGRNF